MFINIFGNGEVYRQINPLLSYSGYTVVKVIDDSFEENGVNADTFLIQAKIPCLFCVGYRYLQKRLSRFNELKKNSVELISFVANNSIVSEYSTIGDGCIINQGTIIDNFVTIGNACFFNIGCMISHDCKIHDGVFIAPGASVAGFVEIGECTFVGVNATIINHVKIGKNVIIAGGAVVINDIPDNVMVAGNPATIKKYL